MRCVDKSNYITEPVSAVKRLSVWLMILALVFLTSVNFFIYSSDSVTSILIEVTDGDLPSPTGPAEEKSGSGSSSLNILEEMIHEANFYSEMGWFNKVFLHKVAETQKIERVHYDRWSPPPEA